MQSANVPPETSAIRRLVVLAVLTAFAASVPTAGASQDQSSIDAFARQIAADVREDGVGAVTAAVFRGDQVLWAQGFGWADPDRRVPAGVRTIYRVGSISKSVTAVLMAVLVEDGVVKLDDAVISVLPEVGHFLDPTPGVAPITFRQLASHTAGLIREPDLEDAASGPIADWGHKILTSMRHTRFFAVPGSRYSYSNIGYGVLGYALQRASGAPFIELVHDRVFEPLGMRSSAFVIGPELQRRLAVGFANRSYVEGAGARIDVGLPAREHAGRGYKVPNGGVYSTVADLATFAAAVMGRTEVQLLRPSSRAELMRAQTPAGSTDLYGLGFSISEVTLAGGAGQRLVGHGGSVAGYTAQLVFEPDSGYGVALLRNYNAGTTDLAEAGAALLTALLEAHGEP